MRTALIAIAALVAGASPSLAEPDYSEKEVREVAARYATCAIKGSLLRARAYVISRDRSPPIDGDCLNQAARFMHGGSMRFPDAMYRYGLAEALLVRDYPGGVPAGVATAPALAHPEVGEPDPASLPRNAKRAAEVRDHYAKAAGFRTVDIVTDCVVRTDPDAAYALVRTPVNGPEETAAFARVKPVLAGCLPPDNTVRMNRSVLRGSIAYNLYQLAYAVSPPAGRRA